MSWKGVAVWLIVEVGWSDGYARVLWPWVIPEHSLFQHQELDDSLLATSSTFVLESVEKWLGQFQCVLIGNEFRFRLNLNCGCGCLCQRLKAVG